jgi:hypothetical protein
MPKPQSTDNKESEVSTTETPAPEAAAAAPVAEKKKKDPVPEGFVTPVEFAKQLGKRQGGDENTVRPQIIYGYIRNAKDFPFQNNSDGRFLVNLEAGNAWIDAKNERKTARDAKKAAEAKAAAEKAAAEAAKAPAQS